MCTGNASVLPKGNQYRWLWRTFGLGQKFKRTPLPPKPYDDRQSTALTLKNRGYEEHIAGVDPEKPHWRDPKYESRAKTPFFDLFGFNRNYSYSMFKMSLIIFVFMLSKEVQASYVLQENAMNMVGKQPVPAPEWARDDKANERELRAAGFALVGYKQLDNVGERQSNKG